MKKIVGIVIVALIVCLTIQPALAAATTYTVAAGDSLWKIAVKYQIGVSELIEANPQISNPNMIYAGQKVNIPEASSLQAFETECIRLVNVERTNRGLQTLATDWQLCRVARYKAQDMVLNNYFSHTSPTYGSPFTMMQSFGLKFSAAAENIAYGQRTAQEVVTAWMNSPGHRANILTQSCTHIGVGAAKTSSGTLYWSQMFMKPY